MAFSTRWIVERTKLHFSTRPIARCRLLTLETQQHLQPAGHRLTESYETIIHSQTTGPGDRLCRDPISTLHLTISSASHFG